MNNEHYPRDMVGYGANPPLADRRGANDVVSIGAADQRDAEPIADRRAAFETELASARSSLTPVQQGAKAAARLMATCSDQHDQATPPRAAERL